MQLLELSLHNYKVHRKKTIKFKPGVVGIVGDNGTGKSSIISAICFLFTGEYDTSRKDECITMGETEGWVKGIFKLNGKEGSIERHLSSSKVVLVYDGIPYNKFNEVNQLWSELLQIDTNIFNNVIVAKQGEIQNLFSDESTVREKIFQKIFMVPPTEKIRKVIWDNYIKLAPPEKPEEDILQLQAMQANIAHNRNKILCELDTQIANAGDPAKVKIINDRISWLERCQSDLSKRPGIETQITEFNQEFSQNQEKITALDEYINSQHSLVDYKKYRDKLMSVKPVFERKTSLSSEIDKLHNSTNQTDIDNKTIIVRSIDEKKAETATQITELSVELKQLLRDKNHLISLKDHSVCPTCYQDIPDSTEHLQKLMDTEIDITAKLKELSNTHNDLAKKSQVIWSELSKSNQLLQRIKYLEDELTKLIDIEFSQQEFDDLGAHIKGLESFIEACAYYKNRQSEITTELRVLNERLRGLDIYDGSTDVETELIQFRALIESNDKIQSEISDLQLQIAKLEHELLLFNSRIDLSTDNRKYNDKRKEYLYKLESVHELFNVTKFPRRLIATYMSAVQTSLATYLEYFNLPYTVRITDGFKIRLYNEDDLNKPLPMVSGGQEMMVGICLRLALHKMFAQAFPIWIIDEGTTHLSDNKKQAYFDLINELRKQKIINQIIVIDHDERLSTVVDQIIEL